MPDLLPSPFWSVVTGIGLIGWIAAVISLIRWGFLPDGSLCGRRTFCWVAIVVIFFSIWIMGVKML